MATCSNDADEASTSTSNRVDSEYEAKLWWAESDTGWFVNLPGSQTVAGKKFEPEQW